MNEFIDYIYFFEHRLRYEGPLMFAGLVGIILALVFWRRCRGAAVVVLTASLVQLGTAIVVPVLVAYLPTMIDEWGSSKTTQAGVLLGLANELVRGLAVMVLPVAVFVVRKQPTAQA